jgi:Holliday junction resolvasome RuvABC endonuclease subunit
MTIILALDLGTTTGWAIGGSVQRSIVSGSQSFKPGRFEGGGMRYLKMRKWLSDIYELQRFTLVTFEEVRRHLGVDAAHAYGGFLSTLTAWCEEHKIPYHGVPVQSIKQAVGLKGNAKKELVIAAVKKLGHAPKDDNEADAIALLIHSVKPDQYLEGMKKKPRVRLKR